MSETSGTPDLSGTVSADAQGNITLPLSDHASLVITPDVGKALLTAGTPDANLLKGPGTSHDDPYPFSKAQLEGFKRGELIPAKLPLVLAAPEKFRKTLDAWREVDKDLEEFVDGLSPEKVQELLAALPQGTPEFLFPAQEKHFRDVAGTPRPKGTADPIILWLMERIRALEDRIRHPVLKVDDNQDRAIAMCIERIGDLEKSRAELGLMVANLKSEMRVQTALMVDTRLAVKGLQKS